jgi:hypothetical protein
MPDILHKVGIKSSSPDNVLFKHQGWKEPVEFMHHCSTKWAVFLLSLKSLLETKARPGQTRSSSTDGNRRALTKDQEK